MQYDNNPGRHTRRYAIVKLVAKVAFFLFYKRIHISGQENIPEGGKIIFAANHQNALMDALAVIMTNNYQPVYLARADIFKNSFIVRILGYLKIMPVYRVRDGIDTMGQNEDVFDKTSRILASGGCVGIMPEGNHGDQKRLRVLKKGIFRIAFKAGEINETHTDVKIVPVGLDYSKHDGFFEELVVNYGQPLVVSDYLAEYDLHPQKGINAMKKDLSDSLRSLMIDIKDEENYSADNMLVEFGSLTGKRKLGGNYDNLPGRFAYARVLSQSMYEYFESNPGHADEIRSRSRDLYEVLKSHGCSSRSINIFSKRDIWILKLKRILCFPVILPGFILHMMPLALIHCRLKKTKDSQFISSMKFVLGLILVPFNYVLLSVILFLFLTPVLAAILVACIPVAGFIAYSCFQYTKKTGEIICFNNLYRHDKELAGIIDKLRLKLDQDLEPVFRIVEEKLK